MEILASLIVVLLVMAGIIWLLSKITVPLLKALVSLIAFIIFAGIIGILGLAIYSMGLYAFVMIGFFILLIIINIIF